MDRKYVIKNTQKREEFLPFHRYSFDEEEKKAILEVLDSGWITTGPRTKKFEEDFASYIGCKHAIALNSCTAGLHLSLVANNIGPGDQVLVPAMTFAATANVVEHTGATPVIVDIDPDTLNIDVNILEEKITPATKAVIPVHMTGQPCDMDKIHYLAAKYNLVVIEDAAHATESWYKGRKIGNLSQLTAFSFYATKNITTAEGGMLTTNDDALAEKIRVLSLHGMSKDAWKRYSNEGYKHYDIKYPGFKYNMTDMQACLGIVQLKKINSFLEKRNSHKLLYDSLLKDIPEIKLIREIPDIVHARHLYIIQLDLPPDTIDRDQFMNSLIRENIGLSVNFIALHLHSYYRDKYNLKREDFPFASRASDTIISLPFYPKLKEEDIIYVCAKIKELVENIKTN
jgi:dTDP-4-amino-4,6-dideoxygalactose transaminase